MSSNIGIIFLLMFPSLIIAENSENETNVLFTREIFLTIGIVFASTIATFSLIAFIFFTLRCIKRKISEPQYYIDDISSNRDSNKCNDGVNNLYAHVPNINEIQPSLNILHMASTVKQSLLDLRDCLLPLSCSHNQHMHNPGKPVNEKGDFSI